MTMRRFDSSSPVVSHDEAVALATRLLDMLPKEAYGVAFEHIAQSVTAIANGRVHLGTDRDTFNIWFLSNYGSGLPVTVKLNTPDVALMPRIVQHALALRPPRAKGDDTVYDPDEERHYRYRPEQHMPVALWHESTAQALMTDRATAVPPLLKPAAAANMNPAATVGCSARATMCLYRAGLQAFSRETDCEITVTTRTPDGRASGWAGQASRDWATMTPATIAEASLTFATMSKNAVALEPGRRVAILGPAAVGELVQRMAPMFSAPTTDAGGMPFSLPHYNSLDTMDNRKKHNKIGMRVMDPRLRFLSDPADPDGGFPPFFPPPDMAAGFPTPAMTWIEQGILKNLAYPTLYGRIRGKTPCLDPSSMRVEAVPGTHTATIEEMIANCEEGIYVNRVSNVGLIDRFTGMMTGVTRDGCFLVKRGRVEKPLKNFRFMVSPFYIFNSVELIGAPTRVAFGYTTPLSPFRRWPRQPIIVPPVMVRDFNFSALSDAV